MAEARQCPACGSVISDDAPGGLCPRCLLAAGLSDRSGRSGAATESSPGKGPSGFVPPSLADLAPLFPQLELVELLGAGGMGAVYKAKQRGLDRLVALKILPAEVGQRPGFAERFAREARALAHLSHPNIVGVHDFGQTSGLFYFVMELVDGVNLRSVIETGGPDPASALAIVPQICDALQYAHDEGVIHRDVKPENILLDKRGRVKIADFGLARLMGGPVDETALTHSHQVMGTPRYMAPEQLEGTHAVDHRADIYSLGVVFYELLTGELPMGRFQAPSAKVQVDARLDEVVFKTLEKEPDRRYQHASDVKSGMAAVLTPAANAAGGLGVATVRQQDGAETSAALAEGAGTAAALGFWQEAAKPLLSTTAVLAVLAAAASAMGLGGPLVPTVLVLAWIPATIIVMLVSWSRHSLREGGTDVPVAHVPPMEELLQRWRWPLLLMSLGLYALAFSQPAGYLQSDNATTHVSGTSITGWAAFVESARFSYTVWLANPALWIAWGLLVLRRVRSAAGTGLLATGLATSLMTSDTMHLQNGYVLWLASMAVVGFGSLAMLESMRRVFVEAAAAASGILGSASAASSSARDWADEPLWKAIALAPYRRWKFLAAFIPLLAVVWLGSESAINFVPEASQNSRAPLLAPQLVFGALAVFAAIAVGAYVLVPRPADAPTASRAQTLLAWGGLAVLVCVYWFVLLASVSLDPAHHHYLQMQGEVESVLNYADQYKGAEDWRLARQILARNDNLPRLEINRTFSAMNMVSPADLRAAWATACLIGLACTSLGAVALRLPGKTTRESWRVILPGSFVLALGIALAFWLKLRLNDAAAGEHFYRVSDGVFLRDPQSLSTAYVERSGDVVAPVIDALMKLDYQQRVTATFGVQSIPDLKPVGDIWVETLWDGRWRWERGAFVPLRPPLRLTFVAGEKPAHCEVMIETLWRVSKDSNEKAVADEVRGVIEQALGIGPAAASPAPDAAPNTDASEPRAVPPSTAECEAILRALPSTFIHNLDSRTASTPEAKIDALGTFVRVIDFPRGPASFWLEVAERGSRRFPPGSRQ